MNLKHALLAGALGVLFGATSMYYIAWGEVKDYKAEAAMAEEQISEFCSGHDLGGARLTNVICNDKKEICICGDPGILKPIH